MSVSSKPDLLVDARGLSCPLPIVKARLALKRIEVGQTVEVWASWPNSVPDFRAFAHEVGQRLVEQREEDGVYKHVIERAI